VQPFERVIIFLLSGVGDTLLFTPALKLLRAVWPRTHLVALTMGTSEKESLRHNPDLNEVRYWPFRREGTVASLRFVARLREEGFDLSLLPCPSNRLQYNVIAFLIGARRRAGFRYLRQSRRNLDFLNTDLQLHTDNVHNVEHNIALVESLSGISRDDVPGWDPSLRLVTSEKDREEAGDFLRKEKLAGARCVGLHVSSSRVKHMERKCWPKESFLALMENLAKICRLRFILLCGEEDLPETEWLARRGGPDVHVAMKLPLRTAAELIRACSVFISNDSGMLHVASAVRTPTVAIFGPTNPRRTAPWQGPGEIVRLDLPCSPCFYHTSHELTCPARINFACLRELPVERVLAAASRVLSAPDH